MAARLKVFRTAIGFHDAYVAAPSQAAALAAWGTDKPLFARGLAEVVTDAALTEAPLAKPGTVVKRLRGTAAEQLAALPPDTAPSAKATKPARTKPSPPKPSRAVLDEAEQALADAETRFRAEQEKLEHRERTLRAKRKALEEQRSSETDQLRKARNQAARSYERAMAKWSG